MITQYQKKKITGIIITIIAIILIKIILMGENPSGCEIGYGYGYN